MKILQGLKILDFTTLLPGPYATLMLGDNFVKRNCQYKNNVTIKGLIQAGNNPEHITFDTRVNVSQSNPFYVAMLRERDHDAHFCVTPMDVYMFDDKGENDNVTMTVEVESPDVNNWIRLEKVPAANMENGTVPENLKDKCLGSDGKPWHAGNGKRRYFTTSMMKAPDYDGLQSSVTLKTSRDRVYVYLDENLKLEDREANLKLTYTAEDGSTIDKTIKIVQAHLIPVTYINEDMSNREETIYMEKYEEYLDHYDPLDTFNDDQLYPGLIWGWGDQAKTFSTLSFWKPFWEGIVPPHYIDVEPSHNWYWGFDYSALMIRELAQGVMNLNTPPLSAVQYCHNKNKRSEGGTVPFSTTGSGTGLTNPFRVETNECKWFLPGIRQMERALTQQYNTFPEFQNNFYWSCAVSEKLGSDSGQDAKHARATKINPDGSYIQSGGAEEHRYPNGGCAPRSTLMRIRAFRNDLIPANY